MNVRVASVPFGRIGVIASRTGEVIEVFLPRYVDVIAAGEQPPHLQKAYIISCVIKVDGAPVSISTILNMYWDETERILAFVRKYSNLSI
jgi:hypothetical protein